MKRTLVSSILLSLSLSLAGCGAAEQNLDLGSRGTGEAEMEGPDADGNFYVLGFAGAAAAGENVRLVNTLGDATTVTAEEDGSFAGLLWSSMDKLVEVHVSGSVSSAAVAAPQKINVNYASRLGLEAVPGLGTTLAERILARRGQFGLFAEVDDLKSIQGIGPASLEMMRPYVETKIDVNVATKNQLMALPTIGASKASGIIAYRNANGPFASVTELLDVLSMADYEMVKPFVKAGDVPTNPGAALVNVNKDNFERLLTLPGIGQTKAKAIIDYRKNHGAFYAKEDLLYVPGIGPSTLSNLRPRITVGVLDVKVGTFVTEGSWSHKVGTAAATTENFPKPVLVKMERSIASNELLVTFVGGGYCDDSSDCAPFTLKGTVIAENADGSFRYRLSGYMPADGGNFQVFAAQYDEGDVTEMSSILSFTAIRGNERYVVTLMGNRIVE